MAIEARLQDRQSDREVRKKASMRVGVSRNDAPKWTLVKVAAFLGGGLIYGLAEGAGVHLWQPVSAAITANPWSWPALLSAPLVALGFAPVGRARVCAILRWIIARLDGGR